MIQIDREKTIKVISVDEYSLSPGLLGKIKDLGYEYQDWAEDSNEHMYNIGDALYQLKNLTGQEVEELQELMTIIEMEEAAYVRFIKP